MFGSFGQGNDDEMTDDTLKPNIMNIFPEAHTQPVELCDGGALDDIIHCVSPDLANLLQEISDQLKSTLESPMPEVGQEDFGDGCSERSDKTGHDSESDLGDVIEEDDITPTQKGEPVTRVNSPGYPKAQFSVISELDQKILGSIYDPVGKLRILSIYILITCYIHLLYGSLDEAIRFQCAITKS